MILEKIKKHNVLNLPVNLSAHFFPQLSDQLTPAHILADPLLWGG